MQSDLPAVNSSASYTLSTLSYEALAQARDHLRLLAQLTEPQGAGVADVVYLSAGALAQCFDRLADELDCIVQVAEPVAPNKGKA